VDDVDAALEFYGDIFDFTLRGRGRGMAFIDMGDQFIAIEEKRTQKPDTLRHFGLVVDDREAVRRRLEELDIEPLPIPAISQTHTPTVLSPTTPGSRGGDPQTQAFEPFCPYGPSNTSEEGIPCV